MHILAIDTSGDSASVALLSDGTVRAESVATVGARAAESLLSQVDEALALGHLSLAEIDLIAVGLGPGGFTGTRIAVATAKGFALAHGTPVVGVSSLAALTRALPAVSSSTVLVPVVAVRSDQAYAVPMRCSAQTPVQALGAPICDEPSAVGHAVRAAFRSEEIVWFGPGVARFGAALVGAAGAPANALVDRHCQVNAACLAEEGRLIWQQQGATDVAQLEPLYFRSEVL